MDSGPTSHQGGPDDGAAFRIADGRLHHRVKLFADSWVRECKIAESIFVALLLSGRLMGSNRRRGAKISRGTRRMEMWKSPKDGDSTHSHRTTTTIEFEMS
jgi:hypothetical protein